MIKGSNRTFVYRAPLLIRIEKASVENARKTVQLEICTAFRTFLNSQRAYLVLGQRAYLVLHLMYSII